MTGKRRLGVTKERSPKSQRHANSFRQSYKTLSELDASQTTLKAEFQAAQTEIQNLKEELQIKNEHLVIAQKTANEAQAMARGTA